MIIRTSMGEILKEMKNKLGEIGEEMGEHYKEKAETSVKMNRALMNMRKRLGGKNGRCDKNNEND